MSNSIGLHSVHGSDANIRRGKRSRGRRGDRSKQSIDHRKNVGVLNDRRERIHRIKQNVKIGFTNHKEWKKIREEGEI